MIQVFDKHGGFVKRAERPPLYVIYVTAICLSRKKQTTGYERVPVFQKNATEISFFGACTSKCPVQPLPTTESALPIPNWISLRNKLDKPKRPICLPVLLTVHFHGGIISVN